MGPGPIPCASCGRLHRVMVRENQSGTFTFAVWNPQAEQYEEFVLSREAGRTLAEELCGE